MTDIEKPAGPENLRWWFRLLQLEDKLAEVHHQVGSLLETNLNLWQANERLRQERDTNATWVKTLSDKIDLLEKICTQQQRQIDHLQSRLTAHQLPIPNMLPVREVEMRYIKHVPRPMWCDQCQRIEPEDTHE